ncbi:MAG: hypothetical protein HON47_03220 [Candidatus Diapherotrites archaeon]|jgi:hypothetical protein|uniref:Uncharacterized protein n=1 Tax=Candidatus Iainarchaeum sp. TaxID=3101447 RepID=A0A8T5GFS9_9ARCH|nr:hypothetical protein [Candidatus Diapherotrites archaeon]
MPKRKIVAKVLTNKQAVQNFVAKRRPTLLGVKKLMKTVEGMLVPAQTRTDVLNGYNLTPEQMIKKGKIPVIFFNGKEPKYGCYQMCSVMYAALKEMGLKPKMTRYFISNHVPHSTILFSLNGKIYEADPFYNSQLNRVDKTRLEQIKELKKMKKFRFIKPGDYTKPKYDKERKTGKFHV